MLPLYPIPNRGTYPSTDASSPDLRSYLKAEYRAEIGWLRAEMARWNARSRPRLWVWLRRRLSRGRPDVAESQCPGGTPRPLRAPDETGPGSKSEDRDVADLPDSDGMARDCGHPLFEFLGGDGHALFSRCVTCGAVAIGQGGRRWIVPPPRRPERGERSRHRTPPEPELVFVEQTAMTQLERVEDGEENLLVDGGTLIVGSRVDDPRPEVQRRNP